MEEHEMEELANKATDVLMEIYARLVSRGIHKNKARGKVFELLDKIENYELNTAEEMVEFLNKPN